MVKSLVSVKVGSKVIIRQIEGGKGAKSKLAGLGIIEGLEVVLKSKPSNNGPVVISIDNNDLVIGWGIASKIKVEVIE